MRLDLSSVQFSSKFLLKIYIYLPPAPNVLHFWLACRVFYHPSNILEFIYLQYPLPLCFTRPKIFFNNRFSGTMYIQ